MNILATLLFLVSQSVSVTAGTPIETKAASKATVEQNIEKQTAEKRQETMDEATAALRETERALGDLDKGKKSEALKALASATGKLEIILARDPKLALAPTGVSVVTHKLIGDPEAIKSIRKNAQTLLEDGQLQEARRLLRDFASETVVSVTNLPLATYPAAIKDAVRLLDQNKVENAKRVLQTALSTLVVVDTIIPLPVVAAEQMLKVAEGLAEKKDRKPEENQQLTAILKEARSELEFAQTLGYGKKKDFKDLYSQISDIEKKTDSGKSVLAASKIIASGIGAEGPWPCRVCTEQVVG